MYKNNCTGNGTSPVLLNVNIIFLEALVGRQGIRFAAAQHLRAQKPSPSSSDSDGVVEPYGWHTTHLIVAALYANPLPAGYRGQPLRGPRCFVAIIISQTIYGVQSCESGVVGRSKDVTLRVHALARRDIYGPIRGRPGLCVRACGGLCRRSRKIEPDAGFNFSDFYIHLGADLFADREGVCVRYCDGIGKALRILK